MAESTQELNSLSKRTLDRLAKTFDTHKKPNWRNIIDALPKNAYSPKQVEFIGMECLKIKGSPTKALIKDLAKRGKTIPDLVHCLNAISQHGFDVSTSLTLLSQPESLAIVAQCNTNQEPITIITHPISRVGIHGQEIVIGCEAVGQGLLTFTWFHAKDNIDVESNVFKIRSLNDNNAGYYICRVSNASSYVFTNWALIDVVTEPSRSSETAPLVTYHPRSVSCNVGEEVRLVCEAIGNPEPDFQWYFHEEKIAKATENCLVITKAKLSDGGLYSCIASNGFGTARTIAAFLEISETKKAQSVPNSYNVRGGRSSLTSTSEGSAVGRFPRCKVALLVGNENYVHKDSLGMLVHPLNDTRDIAGALASIGFTVVSLADLNLKEFRRAVSFFCQLLSEDMYAVFYFAGHGFEVHGDSYLMPVDATASFSTQENYRASEILNSIVKCRPRLSMLILDCCRTTPDSYQQNPIPSLCLGLQAVQGNVVLCFGCCSQSRVLESPLYSNGFFAESFCKHVQKNVLIDVLLYEISSSIHQQKIIDPANGRAQVIYRHSSLVEPMSLGDPLLSCEEKSSTVSDTLNLWKALHKAPFSPVTVFQDDVVRLDFIFSAEFSNVLLIQSQIVSAANCSVQFFMPSSIGGAKVERGGKDADENREVVKISNLELLQGELTIHIQLSYAVGDQWVNRRTFYSLCEKPLYAKINDLHLDGI